MIAAIYAGKSTEQVGVDLETIAQHEAGHAVIK